MSAAPLAPVKVLDLSRLYPGAFCTLLLADLGAEVIKVESPGSGDGIRAMAPPGAFNATHTALNRGKRSVALDLRSPGAAEVLSRLVAWADVVIESHRPGQLDELGLGYEAMRAVNPAIVWCSMTGFGVSGPLATSSGHDITFLGYAGLLGRLAESAPTPPETTISIPLAATMAAVGVLATLLEAARSGTGRFIEVNMTDSAMWVLSEDVARAANAPAPGWGTIAGRNVYACADGREVTVAATEPRTWAALCAGLDLPELLEHRLGVDEGPVAEQLAAAFRTKPAADWVAAPGLAGGVGPIHEVADLLEDPNVRERGSLVELDGSGATVLANPIRLDGASGGEASVGRGDPPDIGADTDAVLEAVGFSVDEIAQLRADRVLGGEVSR